MTTRMTSLVEALGSSDGSDPRPGREDRASDSPGPAGAEPGTWTMGAWSRARDLDNGRNQPEWTWRGSKG
jgi:hypothetical protein